MAKVYHKCKLMRVPAKERGWATDKCQTCGKRVSFTTKNGKLIALNPDNTLHNKCERV